MIEPTPGLVIYYDFLWKEESDQGRMDGRKDRPCAIVLRSDLQEDGSCKVLLCPITHAPIAEDETGIQLPLRVARHLGLDEEPQFIKTHQLNQVLWSAQSLPYGVVPNKNGEWTCGEIPRALGQAVFDQILENVRTKKLRKVDRE